MAGDGQATRKRIIQIIVLGGVPLLTLIGMVWLITEDVAYPTNVAIGVGLFGLLWFWFRSLGRLTGD